MKPNANVRMIEIVAHGLGPLRNQVVFVGGAVTSFYVDDPHSPPVTISEDVDCVVEVAGLIEYNRLEKQLHKLGFKRPMDEEHRRIICRWDFQGILVDVMPTDEKILGFSNRWYRTAIKSKVRITLPGGGTIHLFPLHYFIATKLEALKARGGDDLRFSQDLEDIVCVFDGCTTLDTQLNNAPYPVRKYFRKEFEALLKQRDFLREAIEGFLRNAQDYPARAGRVLEAMKALSLPND